MMTAPNGGRAIGSGGREVGLSRGKQNAATGRRSTACATDSAENRGGEKSRSKSEEKKAGRLTERGGCDVG